jgi:hypothetical protein
MKCWICGSEADSREHMLKASDQKAVFGVFTQKEPIYTRNKGKNQPIAGIKSNRLKYDTPICARCNNERTQPYDQAWEHLSNYLRSRYPPIQGSTWIDLDKVFPNAAKRSMLGVHLFFVKLFGCRIVEDAVQIDVQPFADAILRGVPHPKVHLAFWAHPPRRRAGLTPVSVANVNNAVRSAGWCYVLDHIAVNVVYLDWPQRRRDLAHAWHPATVDQRIRIKWMASK